MPRVLVLSYASLNEPHRAPYDRLAAEAGFSVHIVAPDQVPLSSGHSKRCDPRPPDAKYVLHPVPVLWGRQSRFTVFRGLVGLAATIRPDIVFVEHDPGSVAVLLAAALAPRARRFAFTVENIDRNRFLDARAALRVGRPKDALRDVVVGTLGELGEKLSSGIACISEEGRAIFSARTDKPVRVVPLGTDMMRFHPGDASEVRGQLGLGDAFVFGYFGRLVPEKGAHLLIEALAMLPKRFALLLDMFKNFEPGSYADSLLRRADELGVRDRIVTIDVPHGDVATYMRACDAVVLPSLTTERWKEQFGRVLPEAMACGVPVVGSTSGNIPNMLGDSGILVPEDDAGAIADALVKLEADPALRARMASSGRARVERLFSVEAQVACMRELFASATGDRSPRETSA